MNVRDLALRARACAPALAGAGTDAKNAVITAVAAALRAEAGFIMAKNQKDLDFGRENGMRAAMLDRLRLDEKVISGMAQGALQVAALDDPVGEILEQTVNTDGLRIKKVRVPFGVIGMIFEARPNVAVDSALLCIKSGNAVVLRGGREALHSNRAVVSVIRKALESQGLPADAVCLIEDTDRKSAVELMALTGIVDLLIPRGGKGLIETVVQNAKVPVIETGTGNCHVYIDKAADAQMAETIIFNAKTSRPSVCNAAETLLVHRDIAAAQLPGIARRLTEAGVELRGDDEVRAILPTATQAAEEDYYTEYNDYILAVKVVGGVEEAVDHINRYGTRHSDSIVTRDAAAAEKFLNGVDAAAVYHNASTRFTDGFVFGLGAEIGISTQKLHARGPMGLKEMTTYKYKVYGDGQVR